MNPNKLENDSFLMNLVGSEMKPLIPSYVLKGIQRLQTEEMKEAIKNCFQSEGLLSIARDPATYARVLTTLPQNIADVPIPEGIEEEEDVGHVVQEEEGPRPGDQQEFLIEVNQIENAVVEEDDAEEEQDEEFEESENETQPPPLAVVVNRRGRKITPNGMIGEVQKGKYSASNNVQKCKPKKDTKRKR